MLLWWDIIQIKVDYLKIKYVNNNLLVHVIKAMVIFGLYVYKDILHSEIVYHKSKDIKVLGAPKQNPGKNNTNLWELRQQNNLSSFHILLLNFIQNGAFRSHYDTEITEVFK